MISYLAGALSASAYSAWVLSGLTLKMGFRFRLTRFLYHEIRPFYWLAVAGCYLSTIIHGHVKPWDAFGIACAIFNWFFYKDVDDDDRWKRRRRKLAERVANIGGRLAVVSDGVR